MYVKPPYLLSHSQFPFAWVSMFVFDNSRWTTHVPKESLPAEEEIPPSGWSCQLLSVASLMKTQTFEHLRLIPKIVHWLSHQNNPRGFNLYWLGSFASLRAYFTFKRRVSYFITATYMPAVVLVILSWCCFWIGRSAVPARVTLSITTILTTILLYGSVNSNMPKVILVISKTLAAFALMTVSVKLWLNTNLFQIIFLIWLSVITVTDNREACFCYFVQA